MAATRGGTAARAAAVATDETPHFAVDAADDEVDVEAELRDEQALDAQFATAPPPERIVEEPSVSLVDDYTLVDDTLDTDGWNGRLTKMTLSRPVIRNNDFVPAGQNVVFEASYTDGRWRGPEGPHVADLLRNGTIAGPASKHRDRVQAVVDTERGVYPDPMDPEVTPVPGLHERTSEEVKATWARTLAGGPEAMRRREQAERADEVKTLQDTMAGFAGEIAAALKTGVAQAAQAAREG